MFALGNAVFACGVCSACKRSFEEVSGETEVGRGLLAPEPHPLLLLALAPWTCPRHANRIPTWSSDLRGRYFAFCLKLYNSCCYACYSCVNNCNGVVKLVQQCKFFVAFYFRSTETVCHERCFLGKRLQASARVEKRTAVDFYPSTLTHICGVNFH